MAKDDEATAAAAALLLAASAKKKDNDKAPPQKQGESLNEYITRLETLSDSTRLRVPASYIDDDGNIIVQPVIIYGVDDTGTPAELVDSSTALLRSGSWPGGVLRVHEGVLAKTVNNADGIVHIRPAASDEVVLLCGSMTPGTARATGDPGHIAWQPGGYGVGWLNYEATQALNESLGFPALPAAGTDATLANIIAPNPMYMSGSTSDAVRFTLETMAFATSEDFRVAIQYLSKTDQDLIGTVSGNATYG